MVNNLAVRTCDLQATLCWVGEGYLRGGGAWGIFKSERRAATNGHRLSNSTVRSAALTNLHAHSDSKQEPMKQSGTFTPIGLLTDAILAETLRKMQERAR